MHKNILLLMLVILFNGCSLLPHTYKAIKSKTWQTVNIGNSGVTIDLPEDKNFPLQQDYLKESGEYRISMSLYSIIPNSIWEPLTFSDIEISFWENLKPSNEPIIPINGTEKGKVYKYFGSDGICNQSALLIGNNSCIRAYQRIMLMKSIGFAFYNHDPSCAKRLDELYRQILWSIKADGKRVIDADSPDQISIMKIYGEKPPKEYEPLFSDFGFEPSAQNKHTGK